MDIIRSADSIYEWSRNTRLERKRIGLVPTMGALHAGHVSLIDRARRENDFLVVSIFVNPFQFAPGEDYEHYPRDEEGDLAIARQAGVDVIFTPDVTQFSSGENTIVSVKGINNILCGESRPTHFDGVSTVVLKLFNAVTPNRAYFGEKDFQQLVIIKKMVRDLRLPVKIVGCPIVRETDGLAMSSRNRYLDDNERERALSLRKSILEGKKMFRDGIRDRKTIESCIKEILNGSKATIDYVSICHPDTLKKVEHIDRATRILVAAKIGNTRLIDNDKLEFEV